MNLPGTDDLREIPHERINSFCAVMIRNETWHADLVGEQGIDQAVIGVTYDFLEEANPAWVYTEPSGLLHICELTLQPIGVSDQDPDVLLYLLRGAAYVSAA